MKDIFEILKDNGIEVEESKHKDIRRAVRNEFGKLITEAGTKTAALVSQLKNNLTVLGRTIYESVKPHIEWILKKLVHITQLLSGAYCDREK